MLARWQATITDEAGNVLPLASVTVRRESSGSPLATLFSDRAGAAPVGNPITADADGYAAFHVAGGAYRITASLGGVTREWRYVGIGLAAETDSTNPGVNFTFDAGVNDEDPGAGAFAFNNSTPGLATKVFINQATAEGLDVAAWLGMLTTDGQLVIQGAGGSALMVATVTGPATDDGAYFDVPITVIAATAADTFVQDARFGVFFVTNGADGSNGADGVSAGIPFTFSSTTAMADPGAGTVRLNNATLSSVTAAAVDDTSAASGNPDVSAWVLAWDDSTQASNRGFLIFKKASAPQNFAIYQISGASTDNAGWTQLALTYVDHAGSFTNGDLLSVEFSPAGNPVAASETVAGVVELATDAEIRSAATGGKAVEAADIETASAFVTLTETAGAVAVDWDTFINGTVTVDQATVISNPTNGQPGTFRTIYVIGNDATDRAITFGNQFLGEVPTITDVDSTRAYLLTIMCITSTHFVVSSKKALGT